MCRFLSPSLIGLVMLLGTLGMLLSTTAAQSQNCFDDTRYDDGTFENASGALAPSATHFVMRLDPPGAATLDRVCLCWVTNSVDPNLTFDLLVWDSDGPNGVPGTLLKRFEDFEARGIPSRNPGAFFSYDLSAATLTTTGPVYVGPAWDAAEFPGFFICTDYNGPGTQPGYFASGPRAGVTAPVRPLGVDPPFQSYVALGLRAVFSAGSTLALRDVAEFILPGFDLDLSQSNGKTSLFSLRNTSAVPLVFDLEYHGNEVTEIPRHITSVNLSANATFSGDVRDTDSGGLADGLILVRRDDQGPLPLTGDYFQVDFNNNFASGERLVRPEDFCHFQEIRFLDFGDGTQLHVLLDQPLGVEAASFTYDIYQQSGMLAASGGYVTSSHLNVIDIANIAPTGVRFGTVVFDFTAAGGGWVSARYSAFGKFSVELRSACRDGMRGFDPSRSSGNPP